MTTAAGIVSTIRRRRRRTLLALGVMLAALLLLGCLAGPVKIPVATVAGVAARSLGLGPDAPPWPTTHETILLRVRFPRVVQGALVGTGLGVAGAALQGLFRNPMADPYVLGLSSGAALGAAVAIVTGINVTLLGLSTTPLLAFVGAMAAMGVVYGVARSRGGLPVVTLLLAGVAVGTVLGAMVTLLMVVARAQLERIVFWLMGGLSGSRWPTIVATSPYLVVGAVWLLCRGRDLNLFATGEETAQTLGLDVERAKLSLLAMASLVTAAAVSASGTIAFVGLIVPHIARLILGADYRAVLPGSAILGASLLVGADIVARLVVAPSELPVGVITALLGGPFFLWLLRRRHRSAYGGE